MRNPNETTLSIVPTTSRAVRRPSTQTIRLLEFIHRFRHVTPRHIQLLLGHTAISTSRTHLNTLVTKGYIAKHHGSSSRAVHHATSYYLTPTGRSLLRECNPKRKLRGLRSIETDAVMSVGARMRYLTLADVYAHFKRHYDGCFEFYSTFDIARHEDMPEETPDGYIRFTLPGKETQHLFIEIFGWNRSTQMQRQRLQSYLAFFEDGDWSAGTVEPMPKVVIVAPSARSNHRLQAQLSKLLENSIFANPQLYIGLSAQLDDTEAKIWSLKTG